MDRVFFEGIRCFATRQEVPLAPLTVLVGENSTGKSTVLALIRLAWDVLYNQEPDFNEEPFLLGAYDQLASFSGPSASRRFGFTIGWSTDAGNATGHFVADRGQPRQSERLVDISDDSCWAEVDARPYAFVIETHSDYLVDRIRMDIRDKKGITPKDVALLYFERKNGEATIHRLDLDEQGNIVNPPPGYRSFFLEEERRFLGG